MVLDNGTVLLMSLVISGTVAVLLWLFALGADRAAWRLWWAWGTTGVAAGVGLYLAQGPWSPWLSVVAANLFVLGGQLALENGLRVFAGRRVSWWSFGVQAGLVFLLFVVFTEVWDLRVVRILVHSTFSALILARVIALLEVPRAEIRVRHQALLRFCQVLFGLLILAHGARMAASLGSTHASIQDPDWTLSILLLGATLGLVTWTLGFIFLDLGLQTAQLEASLGARDRLFRLLAHDLRGPLGGVMRLLEVLATDPEVPPRLRRDLEACVRSSKATYEVLDSLLAWAKAQAAGAALDRRPRALGPLVHLAVEANRNQAEAKGIALEVSVTPDLEVRGDGPALESVVRNLVSNAVKFSSPGQRVRVAAWAEGSEVEVRVEDQGPGIPAEVRERLGRGLLPDSTPGTQGEPGTGLGLSLVTELVRRHGGRVVYSGGPGAHSVAVRLPDAGS